MCLNLKKLMNLEESTDRKLTQTFLKFNLKHLLTKLRSPLVIQLSAKIAKLFLTATVEQRKLKMPMEMNSKSGNVNFATQKMKLILKKKKNQKQKQPTTLLRLPLKFRTKNLLLQKTSVLFSALINLDPCAFLLQYKEKLTLKVIKEMNWLNLRNLVMDLISS